MNVDNVLYFLEPQGKKRTKMELACSKDQGNSWTKHTDIDGNNRGGYSDMVALRSGSIMAVWEDGSHPLSAIMSGSSPDSPNSPPNPDSGNFFWGLLDTAFCA